VRITCGPRPDTRFLGTGWAILMSFVCDSCGKQANEELQRRGPVCFSCHVKSVRLGFTHGKEDFHGPTIKERQEQTVRDAKINGYEAVPVGSRWV